MLRVNCVTNIEYFCASIQIFLFWGLQNHILTWDFVFSISYMLIQYGIKSSPRERLPQVGSPSKKLSWGVIRFSVCMLYTVGTFKNIINYKRYVYLIFSKRGKLLFCFPFLLEWEMMSSGKKSNGSNISPTDSLKAYVLLNSFAFCL